MHLKLKDSSVNLDGLDLRMLLPLQLAGTVWQAHGVTEIVITSARDGKHKQGSLHVLGAALDIRTRTLPDAPGMSAELAALLGDDYDVVLEPDHLHVEYDPFR